MLYFILHWDMIDRALGLEPVARRRKQDNTSETSSKKPEVSNPAQMSPARSNLKKLHNEEPASRNEEKDNSQVNITRSKPTIGIQKLQTKLSGQQELASPAIRNKNQAKIAKSVQQSMRSSSRLFTTETLKPIQIQVPKVDNQMAYKIKMIFFMIVSLFLTYNAMTPARRCTYKKK